MPQNKNLVTTWQAAATQNGESIQAALDALNAELGTKYGHNHLSQWRRGVRSPSAPVIGYMLAHCLRYALVESGLVDSEKHDTADRCNQLSAMLRLPDPRGNL